MKFETIRSKKKILLIGIILFCVSVTLILATSLAAYKKTTTIKIAEGTINYTIPDMKIVAIEICDDLGCQSSDTIPTIDGYFIDTRYSYCEYYDQNKNEMIRTGSIKYINSNLTIEGLTHKNSKCYIQFNTYFPESISISDIVANADIEERTDFSKPYSVVTTNKLFKTQDNDGDTYYYAGKPTDNYIRFADRDWRIIRINGDGSLRIMQSTPYIYYNFTENSYEAFYDNLFDPTWSNFSGLYWWEQDFNPSGNFVVSSNFCNNYELYDYNNEVLFNEEYKKVSYSGGGTDIWSIGIWQTNKYYWAYSKINNYNPTLLCDEAYQKNNSVTILTAHEAMLSGITLTNNGTYLPKGTLTLDAHSSVGTCWKTALNNDFPPNISMCDISVSNGNNYLYTISPKDFSGLRSSNGGNVYPVISLNKDIKLTGSGTENDPYVVVGW